MKFYSMYAFKKGVSSAIKAVKWFFIKWTLIVLALLGLISWLVYSDIGSSIELVSDFKTLIKTNVSKFKREKTQEIETQVRQVLGVPTKGAPGEKNPTFKVPDAPVKEVATVLDQPVKTVKPDFEVSKQAAVYPKMELGFYYDNTNAPAPLEKSLEVIKQASQVWQQTCNIEFVFKGEKHADYVSTSNTVSGHIGVIKWTNQFSNEDAIGEAHMGSESGPVKNFVLALNSDYFEHKKDKELITTLVHEMGHVIGLDHSNNSKSIMFWQSGKNQTLQSSDQAMCLYLRARWSGVSASKAAQAYDLVF